MLSGAVPSACPTALISLPPFSQTLTATPDTSPTQSQCPPAKTKTATTKHISLAPAAAAGSKIQTPRKSPAQKSAWPENDSAAFPKRPSRLVSSRGFKRMQRRQQIQDSRRRQKSRPVVSVGGAACV